MPATSTYDPRSRRARSSAAPTRSPGAAAVARVRWDRLGRIALLGVLVALVYLYGSAGLHMLSTWQQSRHDRAVLSGMASEHARLVRQHEELSGQAALEADARQLGMIYRGEQPYVLSGLPAN